MQSKHYWISLGLSIISLTSAAGQQVEILKCCSQQQHFSYSQGQCESYTNGTGKHITTWNVPEGLHFAVYEEPLQLKLVYKGIPNCNGGELQTHRIRDTRESKNFFLTNTGLLMETTEFEDNHVNYEPQHFCVDPREEEIIIRTCRPKCDGDDLCVRKCCQIGEIFAYDQHDEVKCVPSPRSDLRVPTLHLPGGPLSVSSGVKLRPRFTSGHYGILECENGYIKMSSGWPFVDRMKPFSILEGGAPGYYHSGSQIWKPFNKLQDYCYEHILEYPNATLRCRDETEVLFLCNKDSAVVRPGMKMGHHNARTLHKITLTIAILALLLTTIVLTLLIEKANVHSWTRLSYILSHLFFMFLFGLTYSSVTNPSGRPLGCKAFAIIFHFAALATISWMTVINFDLWWAFKVLKPNGDRTLNLIRFFKYTVFALGVPTLVIAIALAIQTTKGERDDQCLAYLLKPRYDYLYPDYGKKENRCTLSSASMPFYWYGPLSLMLLGNLLFFVATSWKLVRLHRSARRASVESTTSSRSNQVKLFAKIFIISGVTWNAEIINWVATGGTSLWVDYLHHCQAVALFIIFVCKREVLRSLQSRYPIITKVIPPVGRTTRSATLASLSTSRKTSIGVMSDSTPSPATLQRMESIEMDHHTSAQTPEIANS